MPAAPVETPASTRGRHGETPGSGPPPPRTLLSAVTQGNAAAVRGFLRYGGHDLAATNAAGISLLHIAARDGHLAVVRLLLAAGADPGLRDADTGATPLDRAVERRRVAVAVALLMTGAKTVETTPLHEAARLGNADAAELLLLAGADHAALDGEGLTARQVARDGRTDEVLRRLEGTTGRAERASQGVHLTTAPTAQPAAVGTVPAVDLIYHEPTWDRHWEETTGRLRGRDLGREEPEDDSQPGAAPTKKPSQAVCDAYDSGHLSMNTAFAFMR